MMKLLLGKVAVITGSSRGIGRATALLFAENGAKIVVTSRNLGDADAVAEEAREKHGAEAVSIRTDVSKLSDVVSLFDSTVKKFGRVDVLVNNAGYPMMKDLWERSFHDVEDGEFQAVFEVDVGGAMRCSRAALIHMVRQRAGCIINISSTPALAGYDKGAPYTVAKAAILGLTRHLAYEYGPMGIRVNALALGNMQTERTWTALGEEEKKSLGEEAPLRRWGRPLDAAGSCLFLASDLSSFVTGQTLVVDGGTVMR